MNAFFYSFLFACGEKDEDTGIEEIVTTEQTDESTDMNSTCLEDYGFCGNILIPEDLTGTPKSMAISLYDSLEPAGPPNVTVSEIAIPAVKAGEPYVFEFSPLIATGSYYVWIFLYMEGGGEWMPVSGVDYTGHTSEMIVFDGSPVIFDDIALVLEP